MPKDDKMNDALSRLMETLHSGDDTDSVTEALEAIFGKGNVQAMEGGFTVHGTDKEKAGIADLLSKIMGGEHIDARPINDDPVPESTKGEIIKTLQYCLSAEAGIDNVAHAFVAAAASHAELHESETNYVKMHELVVGAAAAIRSLGCVRFGSAKFKKAVKALMKEHSDAATASAASRMTANTVFSKLRPRNKAN